MRLPVRKRSMGRPMQANMAIMAAGMKVATKAAPASPTKNPGGLSAIGV